MQFTSKKTRLYQIEMIYQNTLRFYNVLAVYKRYCGTNISTEEGARIAKALGLTCRSVIIQNHSMITCGKTGPEDDQGSQSAATR